MRITWDDGSYAGPVYLLSVCNGRRARRITIESNPGTPIHADGEVLTESATRIEYELLPGKLTLLTPPP